MTQAQQYPLFIIKSQSKGRNSYMAIESTKPAVVEAPKPSTHATQDLASSIWKEAADFGEGVFHGAVEAPVNGVVQLANHITNSNLPELHLVNEKDVDGTIAGKIGSFVGTAADMIGLTVATGGLGAGAGAVATGLRLAAVGAVYSGVLTPSADNTKNFFADRATSAAVGALTFGAMGAAASGLDALGTFAAPAARSLMGNVAYGAITGAAGGAVNSEATATLKQGKILPSASEFFGDVASYGAFGAALGAASYGLQHIGNPLEKVKIDNKQLTIYNDQNGSPIRIDGKVPVIDDPSESIKWRAMKSPDGKWTTTAQPKYDTDVIPPEINSVVKDPDGSINLIGENESRHYGADGTYTYRDLAQERVDAKNATDAAEAARTADVVVNDGTNASRTFDYTGRLTKITDGAPSVGTRAYLSYGNSGDVSNVSVKANNQNINFNESSTEKGAYNVRVGDSVYKFNGTIEPVASQEGGKADTLEFKSSDGKTFNYTAASSRDFVQTAKSNMELVPGGAGTPVIKVDNAGKIQLSRTSDYRIPIVNGKELASGQTAEIQPGDKIAVKTDVGDNYRIWETRDMQWSRTLDGTLQLQNSVLKPNSVTDLSSGTGY
jgi:hypothetical protein